MISDTSTITKSENYGKNGFVLYRTVAAKAVSSNSVVQNINPYTSANFNGFKTEINS